MAAFFSPPSFPLPLPRAEEREREVAREKEGLFFFFFPPCPSLLGRAGNLGGAESFFFPSFFSLAAVRAYGRDPRNTLTGNPLFFFFLFPSSHTPRGPAGWGELIGKPRELRLQPPPLFLPSPFPFSPPLSPSGQGVAPHRRTEHKSDFSASPLPPPPHFGFFRDVFRERNPWHDIMTLSFPFFFFFFFFFSSHSELSRPTLEASKKTHQGTSPFLLSSPPPSTLCYAVGTKGPLSAGLLWGKSQ